MAKRIVVGLDSSTQFTKALAVDVDSGAVLGKGAAVHAVSSGKGRESDAPQWGDALCIRAKYLLNSSMSRGK